MIVEFLDGDIDQPVIAGQLYNDADLPPWSAVYHQAQRWLSAVYFEQRVEDLRVVLRSAIGRKAEPSATTLDSRTLPATPDYPITT